VRTLCRENSALDRRNVGSGQRDFVARGFARDVAQNRNRSIQPAVGQDDALGLRLLLQDRDFGFEGGR